MKNNFKKVLTCYNISSLIGAKGGGLLNDKALNIKIPDKLYQALKDEAAKKNISLASIVRLICSEYLEEKKK